MSLKPLHRAPPGLVDLYPADRSIGVPLTRAVRQRMERRADAANENKAGVRAIRYLAGDLARPH